MAQMVVDILAGHDGVIDHYAQHQQKCEQTENIQRNAEQRHGDEGAHETYRNTDKHPESDGRPQKQRQQQHHQRSALERVVGQRLQPFFYNFGKVTPSRDDNAVRKLLLTALDVGGHLLGNLDGALVAHSVNIDKSRHQAVEAAAQRVLLKAVDYPGQILHPHLAPIGAGQQEYVVELLPGIGFAFGADQDFAALGPDVSRREILGAFGDGFGYLAQGDAVLAQPLFGNLDGDFVGAYRIELHLSHTRQAQQVVAHLFGQLAYLVLRVGAGDGD